MKALAKRLNALEVGCPVLSPIVKQWLGWKLTDAERATLNCNANVDPNFDTIGTSNWSREAKAWLGDV